MSRTTITGYPFTRFTLLHALHETKRQKTKLFSGEKEETRRRVNVLEYVTISQLIGTISFKKIRLEDSVRDRSLHL